MTILQCQGLREKTKIQKKNITGDRATVAIRLWLYSSTTPPPPPFSPLLHQSFLYPLSLSPSTLPFSLSPFPPPSPYPFHSPFLPPSFPKFPPSLSIPFFTLSLSLLSLFFTWLFSVFSPCPSFLPLSHSSLLHSSLPPFLTPLVSCTSSVHCSSGSQLSGHFSVSVTAHVLCISSCLVLVHV